MAIALGRTAFVSGEGRDAPASDGAKKFNDPRPRFADPNRETVATFRTNCLRCMVYPLGRVYQILDFSRDIVKCCGRAYDASRFPSSPFHEKEPMQIRAILMAMAMIVRMGGLPSESGKRVASAT
jgi:hypothetical protein